MWSLVFDALKFVAALILAGVTVALLVGGRGWPGTRSRWRPAFVHGAFCLLLLLLLHGLPGYFETSVTQYAVNDALFMGRAQAGPQRRVVAIDNSTDKMLVNDPNGNAEDGSVLAITDRAKLARLLQRLAQHQDKLAYVVCDITFTVESPYDSLLRAAILELDGRILLASDREGNVPALRFGTHIMADVTERQQDGTLAWHTIYREGTPSLPYLLHLRLNGKQVKPLPFGLLWEKGPAGDRLVHTGFMPTWAHLPRDQHALDGASTSAMDVQPIRLGHAIDLGWPKLQRRLSEPGGSQLPIVFIGEFSNTALEGTSDRHMTLVGAHSGPEILIDLYHEIEAGAHRVDGYGLILLYLLFVGCSYLVFRHAFREQRSNARLSTSALRKRPKRERATEHTWFWPVLGAHLRSIAIGLFPTAILLLVSFVLVAYTQRQMNFGPLVLYFAVLTGLLEHVVPSEKKTGT